MAARGSRSVLPLGFLFALLSMGCGGGHILGRLPMPPGIAIAKANRLAEQAAIPESEHEFPLVRPAAARLYATGELVVDVMVVTRATQPSWNAQPGEFASDSESANVARFHTNAVAVPAKLISSGYPTSLLIKDRAGQEIRATRIVLDHDTKPPAAWQATEDYLGSVRIVAVERTGSRYNVCFVPILLKTDRPVGVGDALEVRLRPHEGTRYDIDHRWYKLTVDSFEPQPAAEP